MILQFDEHRVPLYGLARRLDHQSASGKPAMAGIGSHPLDGSRNEPEMRQARGKHGTNGPEYKGNAPTSRQRSERSQLSVLHPTRDLGDDGGNSFHERCRHPTPSDRIITPHHHESVGIDPRLPSGKG
jgi:hypothetical protein